MKRRPLGRVALTVALVLPTMALLGTNAMASSTISPPDPNDYRMPDSREITVQGEFDSDGVCQVDIPKQGTKDGYVEVGQEISTDEATCVGVYSIAIYPLDKVPESVQATTFGGAAEYESFAKQPLEEQAAKAEREASGTVGARAALASYSSKLMIAYRDPAFIHLTRTTTTLNWASNGACVTSSNASHETYAESITGWIRTAYTPVANFSCTLAKGDTIANFKNDPFCAGAGNTTYTNHTRTTVFGYPGGTGDWVRTMTKSGGCNALMHTTYAWTP